jgi:hypothetical protein
MAFHTFAKLAWDWKGRAQLPWAQSPAQEKERLRVQMK